MEQTKTKPVLRGEIALLVVICINSLGAVSYTHLHGGNQQRPHGGRYHDAGGKAQQ